MSVTGAGRGFKAGLRVWARIVAAEPALAVAIVAVTMIGGVLVASGARLLEQVSNDDLRQALANGQPEERSVRFEADARIGASPTGHPFDQVQGRGEDFLNEEFPAPVRATIADRHFVVESPPFLVSSFPDEFDGPFTTSFRFRYQDQIEDEMTVVRGRLPEKREPVAMLRGHDCPDDPLAPDDFEPDPEEDCRVVRVPVHEVAVTATTAEDMMLDVGEQAILRPDTRDSVWFFAHGEELERRLILSISGIVELSDQTLEYWYADSSLHRPRITENPDFRWIFAAGVINPERYRQLIRDIPGTPYHYTWRYLADPDRIDHTQAAGLAVEFDKLGSPHVQVVSLLPPVVEDYLAQRALTVALLSTAFTGVLVVSAAAVFVLASLAARRQEATMRLLLERGVARSGLLSMALVHGLIIAVPAVAVALVTARLLVPDAQWSNAIVAAITLALSTVGAVMVAAVATSRAANRVVAAQRADSDSAILPARRSVRDGLVIVVGLAAVWLVRRRTGAAASRDPVADVGDLDVLLAVAPAVVAVAVGVVVVRLTGPLVGLAARLGAVGRGLVPFLGLRRLAGQSRAARSSMMVVLLAIGIAGFSHAVRTSVIEARIDNAWQSVGADLAVRSHADGVPLPTVLRATAAELSTASALGAEFPSTGLLTPPDGPRVWVLALDTEAYRAVIAGSPLDAPVLDVLTDADVAGGDVGEDGGGAAEGADGGESADGPAPAIISRNWPGGDRPGVGDDLDILLGLRQSLVVAGVTDRFPSVPANQPFVVVDLDRLQQLDPSRPLAPTVVYLRAPMADAAEIAQSVDAESAGLRLSSRHDLLAAQATDPFVEWVDRALTVLSWFAVTLAVVAAVAALAITAPVRQRDFSLLAALGLSRSQAVAITVIEQVVPVAVAVAAGSGLAVGLVSLLAPALELEAFTGGGLAVPLATDPWYLALVAVIILGAVGLATLSAVRIDRGAGRRTILSGAEE